MWLCKNHHGLFDKNYYCFDSEDGKIVLHFSNDEDAKSFLSTVKVDCTLTEKVLSHATKAFLRQRLLYFAA